jgi:hypothetical protein
MTPMKVPEAKVAVLEPTRSIRLPTSWMAVRAPPPKTSNSKPIAEGVISSLDSTKGMCTAQKVTVAPAIVKYAKTANLAFCKADTGNFSLESDTWAQQALV